MPDTSRLLKFFALGVGLAAIAIFVYSKTEGGASTRAGNAHDMPAAHSHQHSAEAGIMAWSVGELRANGLRIKPSGRADASHVLDPNQFTRQEVRHAYWIATQIPEMLNKLYCWCGCENRGTHRSNLGCFEDRMGIHCAVCRGTAEIAYAMMQKGITDAGKIQAAVDAEWARY